MDWIKIGALLKPFGLKGEMHVYSMTDFEIERFSCGKTVYIERQKEKIALQIETYRIHKNQPIISFKGYQDINLIESFSKHDLYIKKKELHVLPSGEYYVFELKGLTVFDQENQILGKVIAVEPTGAHSVLRIEKADKTHFLVPYVDAFIESVDLIQKQIKIRVIAGLL